MFLLRPELLVCLWLGANGSFDPARDILLSVSSGQLMVSVPRGAHLKTARFKLALKGPGSLRVGPLPAASSTDEAGEPIWRGRVLVPVKGEGVEDPAELEVTYQPCTEGPDGQCFLPLKRTLKTAAADLQASRPRPD